MSTMKYEMCFWGEKEGFQKTFIEEQGNKEMEGTAFGKHRWYAVSQIWVGG